MLKNRDTPLLKGISPVGGVSTGLQGNHSVSIQSHRMCCALLLASRYSNNAQFSASFLASSRRRRGRGTRLTNIDPPAVTLQAVSGAMFPSGVHRLYLQNIQFGNQAIPSKIFFFLTFFHKFITSMFQINVKDLLRPPPVLWCVGPPFATSVL